MSSPSWPKLMAPKPSSPSYNITATISICINWTKGLHHQVQGIHLYHHHQPSLSKHHGSKAMIKQSSCASTGPSSMWAISICNLHQRTTSSISKAPSKSSIIRGSYKVISLTIMTMIIIMHTSSRDNITSKLHRTVTIARVTHHHRHQI